MMPAQSPFRDTRYWARASPRSDKRKGIGNKTQQPLRCAWESEAHILQGRVHLVEHTLEMLLTAGRKGDGHQNGPREEPGIGGH